MAVEDRILRALLRVEADKGAIRATIDDVERVEEAIEDLDQAVARVGAGQRIQGGVGQALGRLPGFDPLGKLTDTAKDRLEFLGDGFEQLIDTMDELGIELDGTAQKALKAATSLSRINTDPIGAAVNAVGQAIAAWQDFTQEMETGQERVSSAWDERLSRSFESATELAEDYTAAQDQVNQKLDEAGIVAQVLVNRTDVLNANRDRLQASLVRSANSYLDYAQAVSGLNENLERGEQAVVLLDRSQFEHRQELQRHAEVLGEVMQAYRSGNATLEDVRDAYQEMDTLFGGLMAVATQGLIQFQETERFDDLAVAYREYLDGLDQSWEEWSEKRDAAEAQYYDDLDALDAQRKAQRRAAEAAYDAQTSAEYEQLQADLTAIEARGADQRRAVMENFVIQADRAEDDYYGRRAEVAESFGIQAAQAEENHQRRMARMREDAQLREQDLIGARDALGLAWARRDAERQRRRADEDFGVQQGRRSEDHARQLAEMAANFEQQQERRRQDYEARLAELDAQLAQEEQNRQDAYNAQIEKLDGALTDQQGRADSHYDEAAQKLHQKLTGDRQRIDQAHTDEKTALDSAFDNRRQSLGFYLQGEAQMLANYYETTEGMLRDWIARNQAAFRTGLSTHTPPGRQSGGYVGAGTYRVGESGREFVLSSPTTQAAERLAGGRLTQAGVLGAMGGGNQVQLTQYMTITDARDPDRVAAIVRRETLQVMDQVLGAVR